MASVPAKKRGRPRKPVVAEVALDGLGEPVSETLGSKRPRRNASKKAAANLAQLVKVDRGDMVNTPQVNDAEDGNDDDFIINEEDNSEEEEDVEMGDDNELGTTGNEMSDLNNNESSHPDLPNGQRKTAPKKHAKKSLAKSMPIKRRSQGSSLEQKGRPIRLLKDLSSARDKIERIYGLNKAKLLLLAKVKEGFEASVFDFPLENIQPNSPYFVCPQPPCKKENVYDKIIGDRNKTIYHEINKREFENMIKLRDRSLKLLIGEVDAMISTDDKIEFPVLPNGKRNGFVYNTGGLVTDIAWLNIEDDKDADRNIQYLAVAISQHVDEPLDEHLEMFEKEKHSSCIQIFKVNTSTLQFLKVQSIVHTFGEVWDLKWHEGCRAPGSVGCLSFVCQEGTVNFLDIIKSTNDLHVFNMCEKPSLALSLADSLITTFDFLSPTTVVCGFKNGFVAEFELNDPELPSFYEQVHDSYILSISAAYSDFEDTVVSTVSVDGFFYVFNPKNMATTKTTVSRFRGSNLIPVVYCPQIYSYVYSDGASSLRAVPPRAAFAVHPLVSRETTITSIGVSRLHPMVLAGSADGSLIITNAARRLLQGIKNTSTTQKSLKLWKWDYSIKDDKYRLDSAYEVYPLTVNDVSKAKIDAHGINITCTKWSETSTGGKCYAFANSAGLLTLEYLG
ncbi:tfc6p [Saccharomyces arboricola H-6]|uniref:Tfc6p n=1 Tax=Saccharomyces arboricola (strain H-6 / AS 2.3317 / CBS 10644) TaxID=1160507 RepID=J8PJE6_SACAR|nr:tfc6p [Saccharomyces arboricola H-6]